MLQLSEIWIYPVKSLGGIALQNAKVTDRGLANDRRWLLVDDDGIFLTQRENPELALFQTAIDGSFLTITHQKRNSESLQIALDLSGFDAENKIKVTVWDDVIDAFEVSETASVWFTERLGFSARLVYMPEESHRKVEQEYAVSGEEINSFADGYPFLIIGQSSLDDLNSRLKDPIPMNRFRPNFVFTAGEAYDEESWYELSIGGLPFFGVKPCERCVMTTVDQELGVKSGKDPLLTLSKYRKAGKSVLFGQNLLGTQLGAVSVGDEIKVLSRNKLAKFEFNRKEHKEK